MFKNYSKKFILQIGLLFGFLYFVYFYIIYYAGSDMPVHTMFAREMLEGKIKYSGNFILYGLINFLTVNFSLFFSKLLSLTDISNLSLCLLLAAATTYRFCWVYNNIQEDNANWKRFLIALSFLFVFAIPIPSIIIKGNWYLSNFVPNVWHNSTTIFLFPFAITLFEMSMKQINEYCGKRNKWIIILVILNIFIKPSYFFVWVCVYPFFLLLNYGLSSKLLKSLIPVIVGIIFLFIEYLYIYFFNSDGTKVAIKPFLIFTYFSRLRWLPLTLIFSYLFPGLYFLLNIKRLYKNKEFLFCYISLFIAIIIFMLFIETEPRTFAGNFAWQIFICTWLCFYVTVSDLLKLKNINISPRTYILSKTLIIIYIIHTLIGIIYLGRYLLKGTYY